MIKLINIKAQYQYYIMYKVNLFDNLTKSSKAINVDAIELDCQLTKDGQVVVSHDNSLLRIAGVDKLISDLNYNELPEILEDHIEDVLLNSKLYL